MLTQERLKELLHYNPETGIFTWLVYRSRYARVGSVAGTIWLGRIVIMIDRKHYKAHRLAWLYVHGKFPTNQIDHINEEPSDNRITNLREATNAQNQENAKKPQANNKLGLRGVSQFRGRYQAAIRHKRIQYHLGFYKTPEEAKAVYDKKKRELHPFSVT